MPPDVPAQIGTEGQVAPENRHGSVTNHELNQSGSTDLAANEQKEEKYVPTESKRKKANTRNSSTCKFNADENGSGSGNGNGNGNGRSRENKSKIKIEIKINIEIKSKIERDRGDKRESKMENEFNNRTQGHFVSMSKSNMKSEKK